MLKSRYATDVVYPSDTEGKTISECQKRFEDWLATKKYLPAPECCPYDQDEGYIGAVDADEVLGTYLDERPNELPHHDELLAHAYDIGTISNMYSD